MKSIIKLEGVSKIYKQGDVEVLAVNDVSLEITAGELTAMGGPSGSGKSTLLNLIGALDSPTSGVIYVDGDLTTGYTSHQQSALRRHKMGFIFQSYHLIPVLTAVENAAYVLTIQGVPRSERRAMALEALDSVGIADLQSRYPRQLSGGQQQRVAIARALASSPAIILADEPTANLDSKTSESFLELVSQLNKTSGITFLISTHDKDVMSYCDRLIWLRDGQIHYDGNEKEFNFTTN